MKKKCFKKTVSWALSIVMSATMAVTPVLADTFTDGSQSIISENAEILTVDAESATDCGDVASTEENLTEPALLSETEEKFDNPEYAEFSGGNEAEVVSEFSDNSVPVAQTGGNNVVYLDSRSGNDTNDGSSVENAVGTLAKAIAIANGGIIYLLNPIDINKNVTLENVTLRPGRSTMSHMLYIRGDVTLQNIIINNITPDGTPCQFSANPIEVAGTLTIEDGTKIGPFPGKSCIIVSQRSTVNLNGGEILRDKQNTVKYGGGIYAPGQRAADYWDRAGRAAAAQDENRPALQLTRPTPDRPQGGARAPDTGQSQALPLRRRRRHRKSAADRAN